jgi:hypothetical protein
VTESAWSRGRVGRVGRSSCSSVSPRTRPASPWLRRRNSSTAWSGDRSVVSRLRARIGRRDTDESRARLGARHDEVPVRGWDHAPSIAPAPTTEVTFGSSLLRATRSTVAPRQRTAERSTFTLVETAPARRELRTVGEVGGTNENPWARGATRRARPGRPDDRSTRGAGGRSRRRCGLAWPGSPRRSGHAPVRRSRPPGLPQQVTWRTA